MDAVIMSAIGSPPFLPSESPIDMPVQRLDSPATGPLAGQRPLTAPRGLALRRLFVFLGTVLLTIGAAYEMNRVLNASVTTTLGVVLVVLFVILFAWIALSFMSALGGFASMLGRDGGLGLGVHRDGPLPELHHRTAILMPCYNESPARVTAGLQGIYESLQATGRMAAFDVFILSDTTDPDVWIEEEQAFLALRQRVGGGENIYYRRRAKNIERKAGNIGEWVRRWGGAYRQMLVLDADSVMEGDTIVRMTAAMEQHDRIGLIQTLPVIVNGRTLFARMQQFAGRVYGPLIAHGIAWWHGSEGNYWGHNAVIRTKAFAEQAGLPHLSGRKPFGGHVLSHDFVEAALMRRGGWAIHMLPALAGSYEESPPSLTDIAIRDRRWCQGNLQHAKILPARDLHWISRVHMAMGIGSYITAPLWLLFLVLGILISLESIFVRPEYFPHQGRALFPHWPSVDPVLAMYVFIGTMGLLLAPKVLGCIVTMLNGSERRGCGGAIRLVLSMLIETVIGGLIAPIAMLIQSMGVASILAGRDSGWNAQRRDDGSIPLRVVIQTYWQHTVFGLVLGGAAMLVSFPLFLWMTPVVVGMALAIPLVSLTGNRAAGMALRRLGLLLIPEECNPPRALVRAGEIYHSLADAPEMEAVIRLRTDQTLLAAHRAMLPPPRRPRIDPVDANILVARVKIAEADTLTHALTSLSRAEKSAALNDVDALDGLVSLPDRQS
ncbi:Periplasmic glucan glucosyltransferase [Granulibacter bethesdensis]|uniref:Glucans biosynthesis glucosyltransferase H n=2 Tax=Granulibacter bethesdensis TaxID=364410 RepID=Q0BTH0_GRABC|nr:Periplasmic glucan glucosyltransferase [Granulibacter bethesdensis CGDNIH1]AHJ69229.1 Periplasmic glucan glucosyltransferase [Granulibacter bethesdensis]APH51696.1 Periplasmic glucan glucosyltransferase [Granulibacter bethesdensis]APH64389.1 Periplasmic glucan glucosyltransferase [Granulibacter bethesdensis]